MFLDRDGVLIENVPSYVRAWDEVKLFPFTAESLRRLGGLGYAVFVVTNQAIVGRQQMSLEDINHLHQQIIDAVDPNGIILESYICPHHPDDGCDCRKPEPGSLLRAAAKYDLDLPRSFMIGDAASDVAAGLAAGTRSLLVRTGRGSSEEKLVTDPNVPIVDSLAEAVDWIADQAS